MPKRVGLILIIFITGCVSMSLLLALSSALHEGHWEAPESARALKNPLASSAENLADGKALYEKSCEMCHGERGKGDGAMAEMLKAQPADLSLAFKSDTEGELFWKVSTGRDPMPAFGKKLSREEIWKAIMYAKTIAVPRQ